MASKRKDLKKDPKHVEEKEVTPTYRDTVSEEQLFSSWSAVDELVEGLVLKAHMIVFEKELGKKLPAFAVFSMIQTIDKAMKMRSYDADPRKDDIYIDAKDGDELMPPP